MNDSTKRTIIRHIQTFLVLHVENHRRSYHGTYSSNRFHYNHILDVWFETHIAKLPSHVIVLLYGILVSQDVRLAIGSLVMDLKAAIILCSVLIFLLANRFYIQHVPPFISWIKYFSVTGYIFKLLLGSQVKSNEMYPCGGAMMGSGSFSNLKIFHR
ncbi:hypothetical protein V6N13_041556 [Hibiscus sabdariffa]|uniref:ABC-2 type transporter domain-containing protein n=1 Tax=Hibiscus sabdariffa TaxID=183260 RepID=A0ABR2RBN6_9ROSI